ncbi:hypothetical protein NKG94_04645 [Micromonospora sp. M12]
MTIWSLRRFELIWLMTKGGPVGSTETLVIDLYSQAFDSKELGSAAAIGMVGVVISLIVIIGSRLVARAVEKGTSDEALPFRCHRTDRRRARRAGCRGVPAVLDVRHGADEQQRPLRRQARLTPDLGQFGSSSTRWPRARRPGGC